MVTSEPPVEDMFAEVETAPVNLTAELPPTPPPPRPSIWARLRWSSRIVKIVAISLGGLLLLSGLGIGGYLWFTTRQAMTSAVTPTVTPTPPAEPIVAESVPTTTPIADEFIDTDHDGLSDQEEVLYNTNPKKRDSDEDGLSDREEVRVYSTDPRNPDTDGDSYEDGDEVTHFYHPNDPDPTKRLFDLPTN